MISILFCEFKFIYKNALASILFTCRVGPRGYCSSAEPGPEGSAEPDPEGTLILLDSILVLCKSIEFRFVNIQLFMHFTKICPT
jgi:hypothetical protein